MSLRAVFWNRVSGSLRAVFWKCLRGPLQVAWFSGIWSLQLEASSGAIFQMYTKRIENYCTPCFFGFSESLFPDFFVWDPGQQERVKLRERELLEAVERQDNHEKLEPKHLELIAKREHNLAQQRAMLESVRTQLAEVLDTVGALRALVSETKGSRQTISLCRPSRPLLWRIKAFSLLSAVRRISCPLMLHVLILTLTRIWRKRLGLSSQKETRKGCS